AARADATLPAESDHGPTLALIRTRDGPAVMIRPASPRGSEVWRADLEDPEAAPRSVTGRLPGARTALVEQAGDRLLVLHESAEHGRTVLGEAEVGTTGGLPEAPVLLSAADGEHFESVEAFAD